MKQFAVTILSLLFILSSSQCEKESPYGHLKVTVTYPEAVYENGTKYWIDVPGMGAEVRLYDPDAQCLGIRDARIDVAWIDGNPIGADYVKISNEKGEAVFTDIPTGEYYLIVFSGEITKYTEKYIKIDSGDTLNLAKNFTPDLAYFNNLEPWDHEVPGD